MFLLATADPAVYAAILVGGLSPLVTWLVFAKRFSGKIETTEADSLWKESASIREWSERRIAELNRRITELESNLTECQAELVKVTRNAQAHG